MSEPIDLERVQSGHSGVVSGPRRRLCAAATDAWLDARLILSGRRHRLARAARNEQRRAITVAIIYRPQNAQLLARAVHELTASKHRLQIVLGALGEPAPELQELTVEAGLSGGKFENLNTVLAHAEPGGADCVIVMDDDIELHRDFLDQFIFLIERFDLQLSQPALTRSSHCAWPICRREGGSVLRETRFVEIGPLTAFRGDAIGTLIPFPDLRMGWGLDLHWGAIAGQRGWNVGVVDATPIAHRLSPAATDYDRQAAENETREFLSNRSHIDRDEALRVVERHSGWQR